jgi:hypothetical protein
MSDLHLEAALDDLARAIRFPATPALAAGVVAELERKGRKTGLQFGSWPRAVLLAGAGILVLVGVAGAIGLGTGTIHIRFADGSPLPTPLPSVVNRGFGRPVTMAEAASAVPFTILVPTDPALGQPDGIFLSPVPTGGTITMAWGDRPGYPADDDGIGLVVTEFQADIGPETFEKMVLQGTDVVSLPVNGNPGWWVAGGYHAFFYRDASGQIVDTSLRLVGNALIWEQDGLAVRVEGAPDLDAALRMAHALE